MLVWISGCGCVLLLARRGHLISGICMFTCYVLYMYSTVLYCMHLLHFGVFVYSYVHVRYCMYAWMRGCIQWSAQPMRVGPVVERDHFSSVMQRVSERINPRTSKLRKRTDFCVYVCVCACVYVLSSCDRRSCKKV